MEHVDLFSGIGGFALAASRAGFRTVAFCEIERSAARVLAARFPGVPVIGDVRNDDGWPAGPVRVLTAGFPCQDVSVAGKRAGLAGARTGLFWEILRVAECVDPDFIVLENVPGLISQGGGRDLAVVIGALVGADLDVPEGGWGGSGVACGPAGVAVWRILDSQHFRLAQRRRRWFCVVDRRSRGARALEILLEPAGLRGDPDAGGAAREGAPAGVEAGAGGEGGVPRVAPALTSKMAKGTGGPSGDEAQNLVVVPPLTAKMGTAGTAGPAGDECQNLVAVPLLEVGGGTKCRGAGDVGTGIGEPGDPMFTLQSAHQHAVVPALRASSVGTERGGDSRGQDPVVLGEPFGFDESQVTSRQNGSVPRPGRTPPLTAAGRPLAVAQDPVVVDMGGGKGQAGVSRDQSPTLNTTAGGHAVFAPRAFLEAEGETDDEIGTERLASAVPFPVAPQFGLFGPELVEPRRARVVPAAADAEGPEAFDWQYNPESRGPVAGTLNVTRVPAVHGQRPEITSPLEVKDRSDRGDGSSERLVVDVVPALHTNLQSNQADGADERLVLESLPGVEPCPDDPGRWHVPSGYCVNAAGLAEYADLEGRGDAVAFKTSHFTRGKDGPPAHVSPPLSADADRGDQDPVVFAMRGRDDGNVPEPSPDGLVSGLRAAGGGSTRDMVIPPAGEGPVCFNAEQTPKSAEGLAPTLRSEYQAARLNVAAGAAVPRRLTPLECERLQGFPDGWTDVDGAADSPRYRELGNAVSVPPVEWILRRVAAAIEREGTPA